MLAGPASTQHLERSPAPTRPLITAQTVMDLADVDEDRVGVLAESGELLAFDIRTPRARRRMLRFHYKTFLRWWMKQPATDPDLDNVIRAILGTPRDGIAAAHFARALRCGSEHIRDLIRCDALQLLPKQKARRGPNGSPKISYQSAAAFLRSARVV